LLNVPEPQIIVQESRDFSPQLNVPALASFLFIASVFTLLQLRVAAIARAAERRTEALDKLRDIKAKELSGDVSEEQVQAALRAYKETLEEVENLRTVIPGVARIAAPPADTLNRERMDDNVAAAKQFLNIDLEESKQEEKKTGLSLPLKILLGVVAFFQIGVLLLLSLDPIVTSKTFDSVAGS